MLIVRHMNATAVQGEDGCVRIYLGDVVISRRFFEPKTADELKELIEEYIENKGRGAAR